MEIEYTVLIPVKNEVASIKILIPHIMKEMDKIHESYEVLFINDNNRDNSESVFKEFQRFYPNLRFITIPPNCIAPLGIALRLGIKRARGKFIISLDGDGSHNPVAIKDLILQKRQGKTAVIGGRYLPDQTPFIPLSRYFISKTFNILTRFLLRRKLTDYTSGYRLFLRKMGLKLSGTDFEAHVRLNLRLSRLPHTLIGEIPITYDKRIGGVSKMNYFKVIPRYALSVLLELLSFQEGKKSKSQL